MSNSTIEFFRREREAFMQRSTSNTDEEFRRCCGRCSRTVPRLLAMRLRTSLLKGWRASDEGSRSNERRQNLQSNNMRIHREWGSVRIELGPLWLIRCAPGHPNKLMRVWRRGLPEWNPRTHWIGNEKPGKFWRGCVARLERMRAGDIINGPRCRFPKCNCPPPSPEIIAELKALAKARREGNG
jgi:hypothetical protein